MGGIKIEPHRWSITPHSKCISINRSPELLPLKSEKLYCYDCPCTSGLKRSPALEAGLAGPFPCPWLALTVCFQPSSLSKFFPCGISFRPMTSATARVVGPARSKFIPNTLPKPEFALQHLFQVAASLVLINALPGALPSFKTPSLHPQQDSQPSELCLDTSLHQLPSLCLSCGDPGRPRWHLPQRGQRAWIFQGKNSRIRSAPCTAMPLAGLLSAP